jgi:glucose-1-phosphate thymidylyltransferase
MEEKPINLTSNYAITGLYQYDNSVISIAKEIKPSKRGELEITEINQKYFENNSLTVEIFETGTAWLDTGTVSSFNDAANYIKVMEERQGIKIGCVEEIAYRSGFIGEKQLEDLAALLIKSGYGEYLLNVLNRQR